MLVRELHHPALLFVEGASSVREASQRLRDARLGAALVRDGSQLVGILTERDLVGRVLAAGLDGRALVREVCSKPLLTVDELASVESAAARMLQLRIRHLGVTRRGQIVGVISAADIARALPAIKLDLSAQWSSTVWKD